MPAIEDLPMVWSQTQKLCHQLVSLEHWSEEVSAIHTELQALHPNTLLHWDEEYGLSFIYMGELNPELARNARWIAESKFHPTEGPCLFWVKSSHDSGVFDNQRDGIWHFQRIVGLPSDGICGEQTGDEIRRVAEHLSKYMKPKHRRFKAKQKVLTHPQGPRDFSTPNKRQEGKGFIFGSSDAHGLCYHVQHPDGTRAYYDPDELELDRPKRLTVWQRLLADELSGV